MGAAERVLTVKYANIDLVQVTLERRFWENVERLAENLGATPVPSAATMPLTQLDSTMQSPAVFANSCLDRLLNAAESFVGCAVVWNRLQPWKLKHAWQCLHASVGRTEPSTTVRMHTTAIFLGEWMGRLPLLALGQGSPTSSTSRAKSSTKLVNSLGHAKS